MDKLAFLGILALALTVRLVLALTWDGYWGVDGGASLLNVNYVLGNEPTGAGFPKPPLAPGFTLAPFILTMGIDAGYKVWSALFAVVVLIPVYLLTRRYVGPWPAVGTALFASVDWYWAEMFVTGSHPLIAFALIGMAWYSMAEKADQEKPNRWSWHDVIIIASIGLVPWVNQTAAGLAIIILPIYFLALCWFKRQFLTQVMVPCICAGFIAIGALPWYMQTLPGSAILTYDGPILYWAWGTNTAQASLIALPLGIFAVWRIRDYRVKALGVMLLVFAALLPWLSFDEVIINPPYRSRYLLALAFYPVIAWVAFKVWIPNFKAWLAPIPPRIPVILASIVAFLFMATVFVWVVREQATISAMVTPETLEALEMIENEKSGTATNAFTLSLWVAGINKTPSPFLTTGAPPPRPRPPISTATFYYAAFLGGLVIAMVATLLGSWASSTCW